MHILSNISRSKGNQAMKCVQLIEYNMRNIFIEKLYTKFGGEASPRPFYKKSKLSLSLDQQSEMIYSFSIAFPSRGPPNNIKTEVLTTCFYLI